MFCVAAQPVFPKRLTAFLLEIPPPISRTFRNHCDEPRIHAPCFCLRLHDLRKIFRVPGMWGKFISDWSLLGKHLYNNGSSYSTEEERAEKLVPSKSRLPREVIKDSRRPDWQKWAWSAWKNNKEQMEKLQQEGTVPQG